MGINKGKGGKGRKKQKNKDIGDTMRPLIFKEDGQVYGIIIKTLGNNRFEVKCLDKENEEKTTKDKNNASKIKKSWYGWTIDLRKKQKKRIVRDMKYEIYNCSI